MIKLKSILNKENNAVYSYSIPAKSLKPTQEVIYLEKALRMAITDKLDGVASHDGKILDGHHRWAANMLTDPNIMIPQVRYYKDGLKGNDAFAGPHDGADGKGTNIFSIKLPEALKILSEFEKNGYKAVQPGIAKKWLGKIGGVETFGDRLKMIQGTK